MKVDVVIDFYKALATLPHVVWGLQHNKDYINTLIIVNDDLWDSEEKAKVEELIAPLGVKTLLLDHPRKGFGSHRCTKQGIEAATTEYVAYINSDVVLQPRALQIITEAAKTECIAYGTTHGVQWDIKVEELSDAPIAKRDIRWKDDVFYPEVPDLRHYIGRDTFVCLHRPSYLTIGGHDLKYEGYGFIDYDLAIRWMMHFGIFSVEVFPAISYHLDFGKTPHEWTDENEKRFAAMYRKFFEWIEM